MPKRGKKRKTWTRGESSKVPTQRKKQLARWLKLGRTLLEGDSYEMVRHLARASNKRDRRTAALLSLATHPNAPPPSTIVFDPLPAAKYSLVVVSPPWAPMSTSSLSTDTLKKFTTIHDLMGLDVPSILEKDAVVGIWAPAIRADDAFRLGATWNLRPAGALLIDVQINPKLSVPVLQRSKALGGSFEILYAFVQGDPRKCIRDSVVSDILFTAPEAVQEEEEVENVLLCGPDHVLPPELAALDEGDTELQDQALSFADVRSMMQMDAHLHHTIMASSRCAETFLFHPKTINAMRHSAALPLLDERFDGVARCALFEDKAPDGWALWDGATVPSSIPQEPMSLAESVLAMQQRRDGTYSAKRPVKLLHHATMPTAPNRAEDTLAYVRREKSNRGRKKRKLLPDNE